MQWPILIPEPSVVDRILPLPSLYPLLQHTWELDLSPVIQKLESPSRSIGFTSFCQGESHLIFRILPQDGTVEITLSARFIWLFVGCGITSIISCL